MYKRCLLSTLVVMMMIIVDHASSTSTTTMFLKEILQGRCYERPPTGTIRDCPSLVDGFMGILESHRDADFDIDTFDSHFEFFDFSFPEEKGVNLVPSWHYFPTRTQEEEDDIDDDWYDHREWVWKSGFTTGSFQDSSSRITPEHTPSGAFLYGLTFCGVDRLGSDDCSRETSNAYWKYWEAFYGRFAAKAKGQVQLVVSRHVHGDFLQKSIIDKIDPNQVDTITIYGDNCSTPLMDFLQTSFQMAGVENITCSDDPIEFILCAMADENSKECQTYRNSCMYQEHQEYGEGTSAAEVDDDDDVTDMPTSTSMPSTIQVEDHHFSALRLLSMMTLSALVVGIAIWWSSRRTPVGRNGWVTTGYDKQSDCTTLSSISTNSQRRRREEAVRESSALLDEVTRNLFMDPRNNNNSGRDRSARDDMETVILQ